MDNNWIKTYNTITAAVILVVIFLFWFFVQDQFIWAVILAIFLIILAILVNARKKLPWQGLNTDDVVLSVISMVILGYAWFYMPEQFTWAIFDVVVLVLLAELFVHWRKLR
jgi:asparagine N-glycosylation enzyme membrane subunit Stt3